MGSSGDGDDVAGDDELTCTICFTERGRFKLSAEPTCKHYICTAFDKPGGCVRRCLETVMQSGAFPGRCPGCLDEYRDSEPERGKIGGAVMGLLQQEGAIDRDLQVRFMLRQEPT